MTPSLFCLCSFEDVKMKWDYDHNSRFLTNPVFVNWGTTRLGMLQGEWSYILGFFNIMINLVRNNQFISLCLVVCIYIPVGVYEAGS